MSSEKSRGSGRTRNYACIVYPDSASTDWITQLASSKVPVFVSPLHDKDINPNGEPKKPHYHVVIMFDSVKTIEQAQELISAFSGVGCEVVKSLRAYARYLCHLDNPEKVLYSIDDVLCYGGADYIATIGTAADKLKSIKEMIIYIEENDINCFSDLVNYSMNNRSDWFDCLINSGVYFVKEYIKSRTWKLHKFEEK